MASEGKEEGVAALEMQEDRFLALLGKLIGESESLQDNPPSLVPREDNAIKHVVDQLRPHSVRAQGPRCCVSRWCARLSAHPCCTE